MRDLVEQLNVRIRAAIRTGISGPPIVVMPIDPEDVLATWLESRQPGS